MLKYEARLFDPTPEQVVETLSAAAAGANKRCRSRTLDDDHAKWRKLSRRVAAEREGWEMFRGGRGGVPASQVLAAWWTDPPGRKHFVVRGRRVEDRASARLLHKDDLEARPPLWHAYPEYVCRRTAGRLAEVVCACGCGVVGSPATLGWMGDCCGPCSDRRDEVGPDGLRANSPGVLHGDRNPLSLVACSPDGNLVATVEVPERFHLWDLRDRVRTTGAIETSGVFDVAFTSDGRYLMLAGYCATGGWFAAFDTTADPPARVERLEGLRPMRVAPAFAPGFAFAHSTRVTYNRLELVRLPSGEVVRAADTHGDVLGPMAVSADGRRFAQSDEQVVVRDAATLAEVTRLDGESARSLAFSPDGTRLYTAGEGNTVECHDATTGQRLTRRHLTRPPASYEYRVLLAADPRGEYVCAAGGLGRLYALDPATLAPRATFDWHLGGVSGIAVSADGNRLFTAGGDGCIKVWPIRDLLRGCDA